MRLTSRTEATRAAPHTERVAQREPVPARRRAAAPAATAAPPEQRPRRKRSPAQVLTLLLILVLIGAGVGIAVAASQGGNKQVQLNNVVYDNTDQSVDAMKQLVGDNTR